MLKNKELEKRIKQMLLSISIGPYPDKLVQDIKQTIVRASPLEVAKRSTHGLHSSMQKS